MCSARKSTRSSWPGSCRTVRLHLSMISSPSALASLTRNLRVHPITLHQWLMPHANTPLAWTASPHMARHACAPIHCGPRCCLGQDILPGAPGLRACGLQSHRACKMLWDAACRPEFRVELWSPASQVQRPHAALAGFQERDAALSCAPVHHLLAKGRALHMAVRAGLVAVQADVELQRSGCIPPERAHIVFLNRDAAL